MPLLDYASTVGRARQDCSFTIIPCRLFDFVVHDQQFAPPWCLASGVILVARTLMEIFWAFYPNVLSEVYLAFGLTQAAMAAAWMRKAATP